MQRKHHHAVAGGAVALLALIAMAPPALASSGGGGLPWESPLQQIQQSITGPVAGFIALAAVAIAGGMLIFMGDFTGHGLPAAIGAMPPAPGAACGGVSGSRWSSASSSAPCSPSAATA